MLKCVSARISVVIDLSWLYSKLGSCACALAWQPERRISRVLIYSAFQLFAPGIALIRLTRIWETRKERWENRKNI